MVNAVRLAAIPGGFQAGRKAEQELDIGQVDLDNKLNDQEADKYLGNAARWFQQQVPGAQPMGGMPGGPQPPAQGPQMGPTPPMPGQPSQSMQRLGQPPQMQSQGFTPGPTAAPPQMQAPGFQGGPAQPQQTSQQDVSTALARSPMAGKMDLMTLTRAITEANPGGRPEVIARAMAKAVPLMNAQAQMDYRAALMADRGTRAGIAMDRADIAGEEATRKREQGDQRLGQGQQRIDQQAGELGSRDTRRQAQTGQGQQRIDLAGQREARQASQGQVRQDQRWQQLDQQRAALEQRIRSGEAREGLSQWRAIVDAQHKRAKEIIAASSINTNMRPEEKDKLLKEQDKFYEDQIRQMKPGAQPARAPGGAKVRDRMEPGTGGATAPVQPGGRPRAKNSKTGEEIEWDGTAWVPYTPGPQSNLAPVNEQFPGAPTDDPMNRLRTRHFQRQKRQFSSEPAVG